MTLLEANKLINEGLSCVGMLDEIKSKCLIWKNRMNTDTQVDSEKAMKSIKQMRQDMAKYSNRLENIHYELKKHGFITNLE